MRTTADKLRGTLFNVLAKRLATSRFLDLCAGSGAVGIEALSRGAAHVTFVDRSRKMCALIESNLDLCNVPENESEVVLVEAAAFLRRESGGKLKPWDLVFFDPPYSSDYQPVLDLFGLRADELLDDEALLVVEHHHKNVLQDEVGDIVRRRVLKQGDSSLSFFEKRSR